MSANLVCHPDCVLGPRDDHPGYLQYRCITEAVRPLPFPGESADEMYADLTGKADAVMSFVIDGVGTLADRVGEAPVQEVSLPQPVGHLPEVRHTATGPVWCCQAHQPTGEPRG